jgi:hypothetical protein
MRIFPVMILFALCCASTIAQDTLPRFTAIAKPMNKNLISWTNPFNYVSQISIQRSLDSLRNFKTILTVPDPGIPQNGFVDSKAPVGINFYRLFIVLDSGKYQFSKSKRPAPDTATYSSEPVLKNDNQRVVLSDSLSNKEINVLKEKLKPAVVPKPEKYFIVKKRNLIVNRISEKYVKHFRDSIVYATKDTMVFEAVDTILIKPFVPIPVYKASKYVFTEKSGNVMISLPDVATKKYSVHFFEEDKTPLFEIKEFISTPLVVDKSNFVHSGWFMFELFEDGKLKERHTFLIPREF